MQRKKEMQLLKCCPLQGTDGRSDGRMESEGKRSKRTDGAGSDCPEQQNRRRAESASGCRNSLMLHSGSEVRGGGVYISVGQLPPQHSAVCSQTKQTAGLLCREGDRSQSSEKIDAHLCQKPLKTEMRRSRKETDSR